MGIFYNYIYDLNGLKFKIYFFCMYNMLYNLNCIWIIWWIFKNFFLNKFFDWCDVCMLKLRLYFFGMKIWLFIGFVVKLFIIGFEYLY